LENTELNILRKLLSGGVDSKYLIEIYDENRGNYRIKLNLIQHPGFPVDTALNIISSLFTPDLLNVTKNKRTNPFVRKRCEIEFTQRYKKIPKGEKISLLKRAPLNLIEHFIDERDDTILDVLIKNPNCTEDLIIKFINRPRERSQIYNKLIQTKWILNRSICYAISFNKEVPIRVWMEIIPNIELNRLKDLLKKPVLHKNVRREIESFISKNG